MTKVTIKDLHRELSMLTEKLNNIVQRSGLLRKIVFVQDFRYQVAPEWIQQKTTKKEREMIEDYYCLIQTISDFDPKEKTEPQAKSLKFMM